MVEGYKNTEVGVIPEDWVLFTIEELTPKNKKYNIVDGPFGSNLKTIHYRKSGIPIITSGYVTNGKFYANEYLYVDLEKFKQEKRSAVKGGDIVMAKIGERCGASAILPENHKVSILSGNALKITIDENYFSKQLISQILWEHHVNGNFEILRTTGAQPALSMANLKKYKIPLPPTKAEQTAIANVLIDADALITQLEKLIHKKKAIKQGAMQELLKPKEGWETKTLGELVEFSNGKAHEQSIDKNGNYTVVNSKFVSTEGAIAKYSNQNISPLFKGDITIVMSDIPNGKALAKCFLIDKDNKYTLNQRIGSIRPIEGDSSYYFYQLNRNKYFLAFDSGSGQTNMRKNDILNCPFSLPPTLSEQSRIAEILSDMDIEILKLEDKLEKQKQLKQGMMQSLLTGKIRLV
jgi:type I restriction enzyme S subunit